MDRCPDPWTLLTIIGGSAHDGPDATPPRPIIPILHEVALHRYVRNKYFATSLDCRFAEVDCHFFGMFSQKKKARYDGPGCLDQA